jgi:tetracycline 7-halogenase / FADH2 O2-dependent halogenase
LSDPVEGPRPQRAKLEESQRDRNAIAAGSQRDRDARRSDPTRTETEFDIAVVGSGFAGSLFAMIARRLGRSVILLEKDAHPRFAIGESSSPLANLLLEELCDRYGLGGIRPLSAWGTWQRTYPRVGCGLKRGFTFYGHKSGEPFRGDPWRRDQLLVEASPRDEVADTHWYRSDVDDFLMRQARALDAEYLDRVRLDSYEELGDGAVLLRGSRAEQSLEVRARFVVDASGPRGFLCRALDLPEAKFPGFPETEALYTHFSGVLRLDELEPFSESFGGRPPYPIDDAAVHHIFEGGWAWVLRFNNGIVSAGVAAVPALAGELRLSEGEAAWRRLLDRFPTLRAQFAPARALRPFVHAAPLPFQVSAAAGTRWALLPSAAAFVDPLLSTGFPLTLLGIRRLALALEEGWGTAALPDALAAYGRTTLEEAGTAALLVSALYASFGDFELLATLTLLYFASASYTEAARRLSRPELADRFLCARHPRFGRTLSRCCRGVVDAAERGALPQERNRLIAEIYEAIEPIDVAGLSDRGRRNWHPMEARPLLHGAHKLGATRSDVERMLATSGFTGPELARLRTEISLAAPAVS